MLDNIQVSVRCRPLNVYEKRSVVEIIGEKREIRVSTGPLTDNKAFCFDQVFAPDARQNVVYKTVVRPLIEQVLSGFSCTVFAYGQTGTGKTYTMEGERSDEELSWEDDPHCGIIPRAVSQLLDALKETGNDSEVKVSFVELYNEDVYDLLSPLEDTTKLKLYEREVSHRKRSVIIDGLKEAKVKSKSDIYALLEQGSAKRQTADTLLNACSSRSHSIFSVTVTQEEESDDGGPLLRTGKLNLVDLAGSENIGRLGTQDKRAREAGNINQSLLTLSRVITSLVENRSHIPYRESKLTRILQDSLGGSAKTSIIATISPAENDLANTLSTLDYASRARAIVNKPEINESKLPQKGSPDNYLEMKELIDKHAHEMSQLEYRVRNEVAHEWRREMETMKESYKATLEQRESSLRQAYEAQVRRITTDFEAKMKEVEASHKETEAKLKEDEAKLKEDEVKFKEYEVRFKEELVKFKAYEVGFKEDAMKLNEARVEFMEAAAEFEKFAAKLGGLEQEAMEFEAKVEQVEENLKKSEENLKKSEDQKIALNRELLKARELAEYRASLVDDIENKLKLNELELRKLRDAYNELKDSQPSSQPGVKKANRVRSRAPLPDESCDYANMTFDAGDEILQISAKKSRKKIVAGTKKRALNQSITLSGKKRKLKNDSDGEALLSPIPTPANVRVTRSRATKRKLDF